MGFICCFVNYSKIIVFLALNFVNKLPKVNTTHIYSGYTLGIYIIKNSVIVWSVSRGNEVTSKI